jgi:hypothetical protein
VFNGGGSDVDEYVEGHLMMTVTSRRLVVIIAVAAMAVTVRADEPKKGATADNKLVGTWKVVSAKYGGKDVNRPEGYTHLKHVTPTQFMWVIYDGEGKVEAALGGSCTVKGDDYVEMPEYGMGGVLEQLKGKPQPFKWKVEGNKWYHTGKLSSGLTIEEVWERVEKK